MSTRHAGGSAVALVVLLYLCCGAFTALAPAAATSHSRVVRARAHRDRRRCRSTRGAKSSHHAKRRRCRSPKRSAPKSAPKRPAPVVPWTPVPASVSPVATPEAVPVPLAPAEPAPPVEPPAEPLAPAHLEVTAEDTEAFRFVLSRPSVPAGKVIIEFVNHGQDEHNLHALEPGESSEAGSIPNTAPNAHPSLTLDMHPGTYTLFCSLPTHEARGMKATLVVE
jgi:plastocyanin